METTMQQPTSGPLASSTEKPGSLAAKTCRIKDMFLDPRVRKTHACSALDSGGADFVCVTAIFNGNVTRELIVRADGSDIVAEVEYMLRRLAQRYPAYAWAFDGFNPR